MCFIGRPSRLESLACLQDLLIIEALALLHQQSTMHASSLSHALCAHGHNLAHSKLRQQAHSPQRPQQTPWLASCQELDEHLEHLQRAWLRLAIDQRGMEMLRHENGWSGRVHVRACVLPSIGLRL